MAAMRSYTVQCYCEPMQLVHKDEPQPTGTEVLIEVTRCGVCHTDLHLQDGYYDLGGGKRANLADRGLRPPLVLGHEILGRLIAKGPQAPAELGEVGKSYLVFPWLGCGECEACQRGEENVCIKPGALGVARPGGYADRCLVPHPRYLVDVSGIDPTLAATYACSGLTAYSALRKVNIDPERDMLLLMGMGGVGLSALQVAEALGYRHIVAADIDPAKRELARANGASLVIDPSDADAARALLADKGGIAAAIDFVGARATAEFAISALRKCGTCVIVGLFGGDITLSLPPIVQRVLTIRGSYVGSLKELRELVELARAGKLRPLPVEAVEFDRINEALDRLRKGGVPGRLVLAREAEAT
jgi:D-arabinose 1-dehydrogenase-like Zn-dependent alcohol dehydrogenase